MVRIIILCFTAIICMCSDSFAESQFDRLFKEENTDKLVFNICEWDYKEKKCTQLYDIFYMTFYRNHRFVFKSLNGGSSEGTWKSKGNYVIINDREGVSKYTIIKKYNLSSNLVPYEGAVYGLVSHYYKTRY